MSIMKSILLLTITTIFIGCGNNSITQKDQTQTPQNKENIYKVSIKPTKMKIVENKRYVRNKNETVTDTISHLIWQDNNESNRTKLNWQDAISYCKALTLGNFDNWRLPEVEELFYLSNKGESDSAFVNLALDIYHTNTTYSKDLNLSWYINFNYGFDYVGSKESLHYVRCVRGTKLTTSFIKENNSTLTDNNSKLIWQDNSDIQNKKQSYEEAKAYCNDLILENYSDWRVPSINELYSITDHNQKDIAINNLFNIKIADNFWSYTPSSNGNAWSVNFFQGSNYYHGNEYGWQNIDNKNYTRCVRDKIINNAPTALSQNIILDEDIPKEFQLQVSDDNNDTLTYHITSVPKHGTLSSKMPNITYTPNENYNGSDSFSYIVNDGELDSNEAIINLIIKPINDPPIADTINNQSINEDNTLSLTLSASDIDGDNLTYNLTSNPTNGTVTLTGNTIQYIPNSNYNGIDHFSFRANDGTTNSNIIDANISIIPVNDAPTFIAINEHNITEDDNLTSGTITAYDIDGDTLSFNSPLISNFTLSSNGNYTYNPIDYQNLANGIKTTINIPITVSDGSLSKEQNLTINIMGINDAPIANTQTDIVATEGDIINFDASNSYDIDDEIIKYEWKENGVILADNNISFTKDDFSIGTHIITLILTDIYGATTQDSITVTINAISINDNFTPHTVTTNATNSRWLEMVDLDKDGDIDILSASTGNGGAEIAWYKNRGDFTFTQTIITADANNPESIRASDIDNDGDIDILYTTHTAGASLMQCLNDANQNFTCEAISNATDGLSFIEIANIDKQNDNLLDIITSSWDNNRVQWLKNAGDGTFSTPNIVDYQNSNQAISTHISDFNKDGQVDIVSAYHGSNRIDWYAYDSQGNGSFIKHFVAHINGVYSVDVADINGDGYDDIIASSNSDGKIYWYKSTQSINPTFGTALEIATLPNLYYASGVDMDGDGDVDILSNSSKTNGKIVWYENIGSDTNFIEHIVANSIDNVVRVFPLDIDNDGMVDVISGDQTGNIIVYENNKPDIVTLLPKTGELTTLLAGDDGDLQKGSNYNYIRDDINETVLDNRTNLLWEDNTNSSSTTYTWSDANTHCKSLDLNGFTNWRLPTIHELYFLLDRSKSTPPTIKDGFTNVAYDGYWTSNANDSKALWVGFQDTRSESENLFMNPQKYARCVHGDIFKLSMIRDDAKEIMNDYQHKLQWADTPDVESNAQDWDSAINYCSTLTLDGGGWRVPNINELHSLTIDFGWNPIFIYGSSSLYWSSTGSGEVTTVDFGKGIDNNKARTDNANIRCVRDIN